MIGMLRRAWHEFKQLPPGERFRTVHEQQANLPRWVKLLVIVAALVSCAIGVVLTFIPGPAIVFYALAAALLAIESAWVARALDRGELAARGLAARLRNRSHRMRRQLSK